MCVCEQAMCALTHTWGGLQRPQSCITVSPASSCELIGSSEESQERHHDFKVASSERETLLPGFLFFDPSSLFIFLQRVSAVSIGWLDI